MATLTYWYAECLDDGDCYSVIDKTLKGAVAQVATRTGSRYAKPVKKALMYKDAFDLLDWATSEGGGRGCGDTI
jgi:hypothetical protein